MEYVIVNEVSEALRTTIKDGLWSFNEPHFPREDIEPLACYVLDENDEVCAGLIGETFTDTLFIEFLWVREELRGEKLATNILAKAELEALDRGVARAYLDTYNFQAREFYLKHGFEEVGRYRGFPTVDVDKIFMQKQLK